MVAPRLCFNNFAERLTRIMAVLAVFSSISRLSNGASAASGSSWNVATFAIRAWGRTLFTYRSVTQMCCGNCQIVLR
jgi:hypothetical protein